MKNNPFQTREPFVEANTELRTPQIKTYNALAAFSAKSGNEREVGIILPVGCGKSGCIALAPFAFKANRTLVIAPGLTIADHLQRDIDPSRPDMFYKKCSILPGAPFPEPVEIRGTTTNRADLDEADIVVTNIQQLQGTENRWLQNLPADFFDLILFDEGHHNVATSWDVLRSKFPNAKIVNFSATPLRADGQLMAGRVLYSYPVSDAIREGYVKKLKAIVLNPKSLRYVRNEDGNEVEVNLAEVRELGEQDASFRRSIVTSKETLNTIVDASIRELEKLRKLTGEKRLKIIASALNFDHCSQIVEAFNARGLRADYVHSREEAAANKKVLSKLESHELDVIVQVRKLGEGFDHPFLAVAAVCSVFSNLSPFVQFVGRIMRVIKQKAPGDPLNQGVVVFHAGANIARRWSDFQSYSQADQQYFDELLPIEDLDFSSGDELVIEPEVERDPQPGMEVKSQVDVRLEEIPLIRDDPEAKEAIRLLTSKGYSPDDVRNAMEQLSAVPTTKVRERQAKRLSLSARVKNAAGKILQTHKINPEGRELDKKHLGRSNYVVVSSAIDRRLNSVVGKKDGQRSELTRAELEKLESEFDVIVEGAVRELFHGA